MEPREKILAYITGHRTMTLATVGEGEPHGVSLFYVNRDFTIFFVSDPDSRHAAHLAQNPRAALTISDHYQSWTDIRGVQMKGQVRSLGGYVKNFSLIRAYTAKFPEVKELFSPSRKLSPVLIQKIARGIFYEFSPAEVCFIDNTIALGYRDRLMFTV
jgi:uncharacterized protein YhbP (UPF0306 family)